MRQVLLVPLALVLVTSACSSSSSKKDATPAPTDAATTAPAAAGGSSITIKDFKYTELTVAPGTTITVNNLDGADHTVTSDTKGLFKADDVAKGTPVTFKAPTAAGTYTFFCDYHSSMHGTLTVS